MSLIKSFLTSLEDGVEFYDSACSFEGVEMPDMFVQRIHRPFADARFAAALGLQHATENEYFTFLPRTTRLGWHVPYPFCKTAVFHTAHDNAQDLAKVIHQLALLHTCPFIILTPTNRYHTKEIKATLDQCKSKLLSLSELLDYSPAQGFYQTQSLDTVLQQFYANTATDALVRRMRTLTEQDCVFRKYGVNWLVAYGGKNTIVQDLHGMHYVRYQLSAIGQDIPVVAIRALCSGEKLIELDYSGSRFFDERAKREFKTRANYIVDLLSKLKNDRQCNFEKIENLTKELRWIESHLGEGCKFSSKIRNDIRTVENERKNISKAIHNVLNIFKKDIEPLWMHLDKALSIGIELSYRPEPKILWEL